MELEILKFSLQKERRKETKLIAFEWLIVWLIARSVLKWNWGARKKKKKKKEKKEKKKDVVDKFSSDRSSLVSQQLIRSKRNFENRCW